MCALQINRGKNNNRNTHTQMGFHETSGLPWWLSSKEPACQRQEMSVPSLGQEDPLKRKWQPAPVLLPGKSHGQKEPGGLQSMVSQRFRHDLATT